MKNLVLFIFISTFSISFSQQDKPLIYKLAPGGYVDSNDKYHSGQIYFADQNPSFISFKEIGKDKKRIKLSTKDVKSFERLGHRYVAINGVFYKRHNTETKIKLFSCYYQHPKVRDLGYFRYYVIIKDKIPLTYLQDKSIKNFKKQVSVLLADCPALSSKIANKIEGYVYQKGSTNLKLWKKIAIEYENCN